MTRNERQREILQTLNGADPSFGSVETEGLTNIADKIVSEGDDIKTAIESATDGDVVIIGRGTHTVTGAITTDQSVDVIGQTGRVEGLKGVASGSGIDETYTTIEQQTAGEDIFDFTGESQSVRLKNLHLTWESGIADSDTGHGVINSPPEDSGPSDLENGLYFSSISDVVVTGHDGDSYAFYIQNPQFLDVERLQMHGGGGIQFENISNTVNYGNATIKAAFANVKNEGTAHGIHHLTTTNRLNLITYIRPQVNFSLDSSTSQLHIEETANGQDPESMAYVGVNLENANGHGGIGADVAGNDRDVWLPTNVNVPESGTRRIVVSQSSILRGNLLRTTDVDATNTFIQGTGIGSASVAESATTKTISHSNIGPAAGFHVIVNTDWVTDYSVTNKTKTGFDLEFGTAAPAGGGNVSYLVMRQS